MRKFVIWILAGAGVGMLGALFLAPRLITWWFSPPVDAVLNCRGALEWGMMTYQRITLTGGVFGLVLGLAAWGILRRRKSESSSGNLTHS